MILLEKINWVDTRENHHHETVGKVLCTSVSLLNYWNSNCLKKYITMIRCSQKLPYHPCCIETLHSEGTSIFACGAYELKNEGNAESRVGSIAIYSILDDNYEFQTNESAKSIKLISQLNCGESGGVLDMKANKFQLIAAMSSNTVDIYGVNDTEYGTYLQKLDSASKSDEGLFLSVDSNGLQDSNGLGEKVLVTSTQSGSILLYQYSPSGVTELRHIAEAHVFSTEAMPVWVVAMSGRSRYQIVSGGDDSKLKMWDIRESSTFPTHTVSKKYDSGVTSAQWHPSKDHIFAAGSYDQSLCIWDQRYMKTELCRYLTVGGVWRIKWSIADNFPDEFILTANMQGGSTLLKLNSTSQNIANSGGEAEERNYYYSINDTATFSTGSTEQLVYGIGHFHESKSHIHAEEDAEKKIFDFVSCSFYENSIDVWTVAI